MKNSSFYSRLSDKRALYLNGFLFEGENTLHEKFYSKQTRLSCMPRSKNEGVKFPMTLKNVHINFCFYGAQLCYVINGSYLYASEAISRDNFPNLFVRHIRFHKYLGEVQVLRINGNTVTIKTTHGVKTVVKSIFVKHGVNSAKECVSTEELERLQFNQRMDNTDNNYTNHCSVL